jgi:hypothetical protein
MEQIMPDDDQLPRAEGVSAAAPNPARIRSSPQAGAQSPGAPEAAFNDTPVKSSPAANAPKAPSSPQTAGQRSEPASGPATTPQ